MAAAAAPRGPTLTECCLCSISEALPRFCIRAGESPAAVEVRRLRRPLSCCAEPCSFCHNPLCLPPALQKRLREHLMANRRFFEAQMDRFLRPEARLSDIQTQDYR
jgi:hypothetical protein